MPGPGQPPAAETCQAANVAASRPMGHGRVSARRPVNSAGPASNRPGHWQSAAWTVKVTRTTPRPPAGPLSHRPPIRFRLPVPQSRVGTSRPTCQGVVERTGIRVVQPDSDVRRLVTSNRRALPARVPGLRLGELERAHSHESVRVVRRATDWHRAQASNHPSRRSLSSENRPRLRGWDDTCEITRALMYQYVF